MERINPTDLKIPAAIENQITRSPQTAITRRSKGSTLQKPSKPKLNPGATIGDLLDRFARSQGWNLKADDDAEAKKDRANDILCFLEILGAAKVPVEHWERLYRRAMVTRGVLQSEGKKVPYKIRPEDFIAEWKKLEREINSAEEKDLPAELCPFLDQHEGDESIVTYFPYGEPVVLPCHACRPAAHRIRKAQQIDERNARLRSRRLAAAPKPEKKSPVADPPRVVSVDLGAEGCKNCGERIVGAAVRLSADFTVCAKCDQTIKDLRSKENV